MKKRHLHEHLNGIQISNSWLSAFHLFQMLLYESITLKSSSANIHLKKWKITPPTLWWICLVVWAVTFSYSMCTRTPVKTGILTYSRHSLNSLAAQQVGKTWILCYFMLRLQQKSYRRVQKELTIIENITFHANPNARGWGVLLNIPAWRCECV